MDELKLILGAMRERELRDMKWHAQIAGIDMDKADKEEADARVRKIKERAQAKMRGEDPQQYELRNDFMTAYEIEE